VATSAVSQVKGQTHRAKRSYWRELGVKVWNHRYLYLMLVPPLLFFLVFRFYPIAGSVIAFKKFQPLAGIWDSPWVGFKHFEDLFSDPNFSRVLWNTVWIAFLKLLIAFPAPIVLALFLNEITSVSYKRLLQTIVYAPHFMSWVIYGAILYIVLSPANGLVNNLIALTGAEKRSSKCLKPTHGLSQMPARGWNFLKAITLPAMG